MNLKSINLTITATVVLLLFIIPEFAQASEFFAGLLYKIVQGFLGLFFALGGFLLNNSIQYSIIDFGDNYLFNGLGVAIENIWVMIRDLFNLTFIFGLIYLGFKMILDSEDSNTKRWLAHLIMAALLVNFSLFITKAIVDFTNILATQIVTSGFANSVTTGAGDIDVAGTFMNSFGLTSLFGKLPDGEPYGLVFGTAMIFLVGMFVFTAGAILLFIRFGSLLLYMIFSPLMFIGWVFPSLQHVTNSYWKKFLGRAFFAPIYMLMLYISAQVIQTIYAGKEPSFTGSVGNDPNVIEATFGNTFPPFIISSIFLGASIVVASKLGVDGGAAAVNAGRKFGNKAGRVVKGATLRTGGATIGLSGRAARRTIGFGAHKFTQSDSAKRMAASSMLGRGVYKAAQYGANSSFDVRNIAGFGRKNGLGESKKGGFAGGIKEAKKKKEEFDKALGEIPKEIYNKQSGKMESNPEYEKATEQFYTDVGAKNSDFAQAHKEQKRAKNMKLAGEKELAAAEEAINQSDEKHIHEEIKELEKKVRAFGDDKDLSKFDRIKKQKMKSQLDAKKASLSESDKQFNDQLKRAQVFIKDADEILSADSESSKITKPVYEQADAAATYARQIESRKTTEKESSRTNNPTVLGVVGGAGAVAGAVAGGIIAGPAIAVTGAVAGAGAGYSYVKSRVTKNDEVAKDQRSKYGLRGEKAKVNKDKKNRANLIAESLRESSSSDTKKDDDLIKDLDGSNDG